MNGIHEVAGSIPASSTKSSNRLRESPGRREPRRDYFGTIFLLNKVETSRNHLKQPAIGGGILVPRGVGQRLSSPPL